MVKIKKCAEQGRVNERVDLFFVIKRSPYSRTEIVAAGIGAEGVHDDRL